MGERMHGMSKKKIKSMSTDNGSVTVIKNKDVTASIHQNGSGFWWPIRDCTG